MQFHRYAVRYVSVVEIDPFTDIAAGILDTDFA